MNLSTSLATLLLLASLCACGSGREETDTGAGDARADAAEDAIADGALDAPADASEDAVADASEDAVADASEDAVADASEDAVADASEDAADDASGDAADAMPDAVVDTGPDVVVDAGTCSEPSDFGARCFGDEECMTGMCWRSPLTPDGCVTAGCTSACNNDDECRCKAAEAGAEDPNEAVCVENQCDLSGTGLGGVILCA